MWGHKGHAHGLINASELRSRDCPGISGSRPSGPPALASSSTPPAPAFLRACPAPGGKSTEESKPPHTWVQIEAQLKASVTFPVLSLCSLFFK